MNSRELREKIKALVPQIINNKEPEVDETEYAELVKYPELKDIITSLLTSKFDSFIASIDWVAPRPTTFRINLKNNQYFILMWSSRSWIAQVEGKKYYLLNLPEEERAALSISRILQYGNKEETLSPIEDFTEIPNEEEETPPSDQKKEVNEIRTSTIIKEVLKNIKEVSLSGQATSYPGNLGAFKKYVTDNPKHILGDNDIQYEAQADAILYDPTSTKLVKKNSINKGEKFIINIKDVEDVKSISGGKYVPITFNDEEYLISTNSIKKPTGKHVDPIKSPNEEKEPGVFTPFTPGHLQEKQVIELFINNTTSDWKFQYKNKEYQIKYLGAPQWKGKGNPKTDIQIILNKSPVKNIGDDMKISLKSENATFVESWILPTRAVQILGESEVKKEIINIFNDLKKGTVFKNKPKANNLAMFISTYSRGYNNSGTGPYKLNSAQTKEAYVGENKFSPDSPAVPNCFFKSSIPSTIDEFLDKLIVINDKNIEENMEDLYIFIRGTNIGGGYIFMTREDSNSEWVITEKWKEILNIKEHKDSKGNITYK